MTHRLLRLLSLLILFCMPVGCETDSGKASDDPILPIAPQQPIAADSLKLEAEFNGRYCKGLRIQPGDRSAIGPGEVVSLTFKAEGMQGIGQFDLKIAPQPATMFDLGASVFLPTPPFVTLGAGVEQLADGWLRLIGVNFERSTNGDAELGTLQLKTPADFSTHDELVLRVTFFSIGPTSTQRDTYQGDDLRLGMVVNGP